MPFFVLSGGFFSMAGIAALCVRDGIPAALERLGSMLTPRRMAWPWLMAILWGPVWLMLSYLAFGWATGQAAEIRWAELGRYASSGVLFLWLTGPLGEEFGWRGYLLPTLLERWSYRRAVFVLGVIWGVWHAPLMYHRWVGDPLHMPYFIAVVTLFSFMLAPVFLRGGLLPAMFLHWTINASQAVIPHVVVYPVQPGKLMWLILLLTLLPLLFLGLRSMPGSIAEPSNDRQL